MVRSTFYNMQNQRLLNHYPFAPKLYHTRPAESRSGLSLINTLNSELCFPLRKTVLF